MLVKYPRINGNNLCDGSTHNAKPLSLSRFVFRGIDFYLYYYFDVKYGVNALTVLTRDSNGNYIKVPFLKYPSLDNVTLTPVKIPEMFLYDDFTINYERVYRDIEDYCEQYYNSLHVQSSNTTPNGIPPLDPPGFDHPYDLPSLAPPVMGKPSPLEEDNIIPNVRKDDNKIYCIAIGDSNKLEISLYSIHGDLVYEKPVFNSRGTVLLGSLDSQVFELLRCKTVSDYAYQRSLIKEGKFNYRNFDPVWFTECYMTGEVIVHDQDRNVVYPERFVSPDYYNVRRRKSNSRGFNFSQWSNYPNIYVGSRNLRR